MSPLRFAFLALWAIFVIYPNWGDWAIGLLIMGHFGLSFLFRPWAKHTNRLVKKGDKDGAVKSALRQVTVFLFACFVLMALSWYWFGFWCFCALGVTFVSFEVDNAARKA